MTEKLKFKFKNCEKIHKNYSQAMQDLFILSMLNGKQNGTYLEIGAYDGINISNTYLLEKEFNWSGVSIDINDVSESFKNRTSKLLIKDALSINYKELLDKNSFPKEIDYLQLDIEPAINTLNCLKLIPFDEYKFAVITFETENYYASDEIKQESREYLKSKGYQLVVGNVCNIGNDPFEDWWVHPDLVSKDIIDLIKNDENLTPDKILYVS